MENNLKLYNLLFHYNHYRKKWACFSRDEKREYFNGDTNNVGVGETVEKAYEDYENKDVETDYLLSTDDNQKRLTDALKQNEDNE